MGPGFRRDDNRDLRDLPYNPSFFLHWPSVRSTRAFQSLSLSSLKIWEPSPLDSKPVFP
jgi:hypothetical protein